MIEQEPRDKNKINVLAHGEARWWARKLQTSLPLLLQAVNQMGPRPADVEYWLAAHYTYASGPRQGGKPS